MFRKIECLIEQWLVFDEAARLDAAGRRNDCRWRCVVDTGCQFVRCEATENHGVHGAYAGAGQDRDDRFGDHRHVDDDPVAPLYAVIDEGACKKGYLVTELAVTDCALRARHRAVVNDRCLFTAAVCHVPVKCVVTGVQASAGKPPVYGRV